MKLQWFRRWGILYLPISIPGWIIMAGGFCFAIYSFIDTDSRSHSVSDTMMNFVFSLFIIGTVYTLIAYLTSRKTKD